MSPWPVLGRIELRFEHVDRAVELSLKVRGRELVATLFPTGGRFAEIAGLAVSDIDLDRDKVIIQPHPWRRLKTSKSERKVPLWPQLKAILKPYVGALKPAGQGDGLLFPAPTGK
jgi:integrase